MKKTSYAIILAASFGMMVSCTGTKTEQSESVNKDSAALAVADSNTIAPTATNSAEDLQQKAIDSLSTSYSVAGVYEGTIYYLKPEGKVFQKAIYSYNPSTKEQNVTKLKNLASGGETYIDINNFAMKENRIALIIEDGNRCGSGGALGNTFLKVFDVMTGKMKELTADKDGCAGAKFNEDKTKIVMKVGTITNFDEADCEADYLYEFSEKTIDF